jgi:hypothetical protein
MLTVFADATARACDGIARRDFLRIGTLALGGLSLPHWLALQAAVGSSGYLREKSVVLLYLSGGASHIETFDPKMTAPSEVRSMTGEVATRIPGVTFGGTFTGLADHADKLAIVRSFHHPVGSHEQAHVHVLTGGLDRNGQGNEGFSMGSCVARLRGANHPDSGLPTFVLLTENEVDGQYASERQRAIVGSRPGSLGPSYAAFLQTGVADEDRNMADNRGRRTAPVKTGLAADMVLNLDAGRFDDRQGLLRQLDRLNRHIDASGMLGGADRFQQQAVKLVTGGAAQAFSLKGEDPRLVELYDTSHIRIGHKVFRPSTLGHQMLMARRLCEAGCGFVTVHSAGWDMHADVNNPGILKGMDMLGRSVDIAISAFLTDLEQRGLSDRVLLVITGDFGRTPKVNRNGGRDHWSRLCTLALAGGGLNVGQVIGQSSRNAEEPAADPVTASHLLGTLMHALFDIGKLRLDPAVPRELANTLENSRPIPNLL